MNRISVGAAAIAVLVWGCAGGGSEEEVGQATVGVRTAVASVQDVPLTVAALGTVTPRPGRHAALSAPAATRVARIFVVAGQAVREGDPLIEFERAPFEAAARSAEAALTAAQRAFDRASRLAEAGVVPRRDVDQASGDLARTQADAVTVRRALELATLKAPIAGVVTAMTAVIGAPVDVSQSLVEIADPTALDVVLTLTPSAAASVRPGAPVTLAAGEAPASESLGSGAVADVAPAVDSLSRGVPVRVRVVRAARPLRIGETVFGRIAVGTHAGAVTVPAEALVPDGEGFKVFVVDSAGIAHARPVTLGARAGTLVEIVRGVAAGEVVVTYGAYGVDEGAKVVTTRP